MKNHTDLNLGEGLSISTSFHFSDSGIYRFIFMFASVTVKTSNKTKRVSGVNLVWNHTRDFKIRWVHTKNSTWYYKHDFRPKLHDTTSSITTLWQPFWNFKAQWVPIFNWSSRWLVENKIERNAIKSHFVWASEMMRFLSFSSGIKLTFSMNSLHHLTSFSSFNVVS